MVGVVPAEGDGRGQCHGDVAECSHDLVDIEVFVSSEVGEIVYAAV